MNGNCFEIGTIQAFLDGETAPDLSLKITNHVAACEACACMLAEAEEESSVVFSALDREYNSLVPTQRLWGRINESIAIENSHTPFWKRIGDALSVLMANPSITVAAGVLLVFGLLAAFWTSTSNISNDTVGPTVSRADIAQSEAGPQVVPVATSDTFSPTLPLKVKESNLPAGELRNLVTKAGDRVASNDRSRPQYLVDRMPSKSTRDYLPGEESYVKTIANLKQSIDTQKDVVLRPSTRIAYERDMAVVDDAISKMKAVVRKNPKNQSAKQLLYSSYQNKIDLLNSVADREELMASLQ